MNELEIMKARHSVRRYNDTPLSDEIIAALQNETDECNRESGLHIQLITNEPQAFDSFMAHYGHFEGVQNYFALVGKKSADFEEKCGYYGERLVLFAQSLGLNTCWVALTFSKAKAKYKIDKGEKLCVVIALGYGKTQGSSHKSRPIAEVMKAETPTPEWFMRGMEAVMLAPTAVNQQKFMFTQVGNTVIAKHGVGFYSKVDLGIAKYHFELGAGKENFKWGQ